MNLPEALAREIGRVSELRSVYEGLLDMGGVNVRPALILIDVALDSAKKAAGVGDAIEQARCLEGLRGFTE